MKNRILVLLACAGIALGVFLALYSSVPLAGGGSGSAHARSRFDAIIVLGYRVLPDGTTDPEERARVLEAVREYRRGVAGHLIVTGGPAHNQYIEADDMAAVARAEGVPDAAIVEERQALSTIENACYSYRIMEARGWSSAEVVSSPAHLRRAALVFQHIPVEWSMHAAPWPPEYSRARQLVVYPVEWLKTAHSLVYDFRTNPCLRPQR